jgi:hypothetical protein
MVFLVTSSNTMNLSSGDRPVYFPVLTERDPVEFLTPSFLLVALSTSSSGVIFLKILDGVIPNSLICDENFSVTQEPTTSGNYGISDESNFFNPKHNHKIFRSDLIFLIISFLWFGVF